MGRVKAFSVSILCVAGLGLGGCTTFGTNVSGNFGCERQEGRCAMTAEIDNDALAVIASEDAASVTPAGPFLLDDGVTPLQVPTQIAGGPSGQTYEIAVSFPAYTRRGGEAVEASQVLTRVSLPGRSGVIEEVQDRVAEVGPEGLLAAATAAPSILAFEQRSAQPPARPVSVSMAGEQLNPIERIKIDVEGVLQSQDEPVVSAGVFPNGGSE